MKTQLLLSNVFFLIFSLLFIGVALGQAPQKMSYQAVIRDAEDNLMRNAPIGIQIQILEGSTFGSSVYVESQKVSTNDNGLVSLVIGEGTVLFGDFTEIDWADGPYFVETEVDPTGGENYTLTGTSELLSVPYALYAASGGEPGPEGPQGPQGPKGEDGKSVNILGSLDSPADLPNDGDSGDAWLIQGELWVWTGNNWENVGNIQGPEGPEGPTGMTGPEGPQGPQGDEGPQGPIGMTGPEGPQGSIGMTGPEGPQGDEGPQGPIGMIGPQGDPGPEGPKGEEGESAYQIWLNEGNMGSEADFLDSLQGPAGEDGMLPEGTDIGNTTFWDGTEWVVDNSNLYHDSLRVGIGIDTPSALFHTQGLDSAGGNVVFEGEFKDQNFGLAPVSGPGTRMMWYPDKAAFRVGRVTNDNWNTDSIGALSTAWGANTRALGAVSTAWGNGTEASGSDATAWGEGTEASRYLSTAWGLRTEASGEGSTAWGDETEASGPGSTAWGDDTEAPGTWSTAWGIDTKASGVGSTAWGANTEASGPQSNAWGSNTKASGLYSTAWGFDTKASGGQSTAWGFRTEASGTRSTAWGESTKATGRESTAWGESTKATGVESTAWGFGTEASGIRSTTWGVLTEASGDDATAWGVLTEASGNDATVWGYGTIARSFAETALGRFNTTYSPSSTSGWNLSDRLFVIGNGTGISNRNDALVLLKNGNLGLNLSDPDHRLAVAVTTNLDNPDGDGIALVNTGNSNYWNVHMSTAWLRFSANNNNVSYIRNTTGEYVQTSDRSLKENISPLDEGVLDKLNQINVVNYNYKRDPSKQMTTGFIAQELEPLFPQFVHSEGENSKLGVNYSGLSVIAIQAIQEQQQIIGEQEKQIQRQAEEINELKRRFGQLEKLVNNNKN